MAIPSHFVNETNCDLEEKTASLTFDALLKWPHPNDVDLCLIAKIVTKFSFIDCMLRQFDELIDHYNFSKTVTDKKRRKNNAPLKLWEIENKVEKTNFFSGNQINLISRVRELRKTRNLVAHFGVRRFPNDNALLFFTKSKDDFKAVYNTEPKAGAVLIGAIQFLTLSEAASLIESLAIAFGAVLDSAERALKGSTQLSKGVI